MPRFAFSDYASFVVTPLLDICIHHLIGCVHLICAISRVCLIFNVLAVALLWIISLLFTCSFPLPHLLRTHAHFAAALQYIHYLRVAPVPASIDLLPRYWLRTPRHLAAPDRVPTPLRTCSRILAYNMANRTASPAIPLRATFLCHICALLRPLLPQKKKKKKK